MTGDQLLLYIVFHPPASLSNRPGQQGAVALRETLLLRPGPWGSGKLRCWETGGLLQRGLIGVSGLSIDVEDEHSTDKGGSVELMLHSSRAEL